MSVCFGVTTTTEIALDDVLVVHSVAVVGSSNVAVCSDGKVTIFDAKSGHQRCLIRTPVLYPSIGYNHATDTLAVTLCHPPFALCSLQRLMPNDSERSVHWDENSMSESPDVHCVICPEAAWGQIIEFSPNGALVTGSSGNRVFVIDTASRRCQVILQLECELRFLTFPSLGTVLTVTNDDVYCVWDVAAGRPRYRSAPLMSTSIIACSSDPEREVVCLACNDGSLLFVRPPTYGIALRLALHSDVALRSPTQKGTDSGVIEPAPPIVVSMTSRPAPLQSDRGQLDVSRGVMMPQHVISASYESSSARWLLLCDTGLFALDPDDKSLAEVETLPNVRMGMLAPLQGSVMAAILMSHGVTSLRILPVSMPFSGDVDLTRSAPIGSNLLKPIGLKPHKQGEKPVVFHPRIHSSGYAKEKPWSVLQAEKKRRASSGAAQPRRPAPTTYAMHDLAPSTPLADFNTALAARPIHTSALLGIRHSAECDMMATVADSGCVVLKCPVKAGAPGWVVKGGKSAKPMVSCDFPAFDSNKTLLTACGDSICFHKVSRELPVHEHCLGHDIRAARYFYMDKFVVAAHGSEVSLVQAAIDTEVNDLSRGSNRSNSRTSLTGTVRPSVSITAMDVYNTFASSLIVCSGSNKSVFVVDAANELKVVAEYVDAHSRSIHTVHLPTTSRYASPSSDLLNTFITASTDSTLRLWDVRVASCVRTFSQHRNTAMAVGVATSPCGRFVSCGTDDRCVMTYDVGTGSVVTRIPRMKDTVTCLQYHMLKPVLYAGMADGSISAFAP
eukprot:PhM_4_TR2228/c0_g1_i1/m.25718